MPRLVFDLRSIPVLETPRLRLRGLELRDFEPLAALNADPAFTRFLGTGETLDRYASWRALAAFVGHWALRGYGLFAVERRDDARFIGRVGLINPETWPGLEIAWGIAPAEWGHGYATEAAVAVRDWAFGTLRLPRLISLIHEENHASARVAEKIGERFERMTEIFGMKVRLFSIENPSA
jgi:[ribosomal protein S5]-alanine N-acetyltransferase